MKMDREELEPLEREVADCLAHSDAGAPQMYVSADVMDALLSHIRELEGALREMVYETTHLSPQEDDGSHWAKISKAALLKARQALKDTS